MAYKEKMNASYMQIQKREDSILNVAYQKRKKSDRAILEKAYGKWAAYIEMGYLKTGMPKNVVTKILGNPRSINKTIIGDTVHEQLVYEAGKTKYVYLENGVLTAYQTEE